jgi:gamma-glutamyltranspeptidase/glutathione hydrolase
MVSAGHSLAAATAVGIMQQGGTAIDAALSASAVQSVVEMPWCGLGGDLFMLIRTPDEGVLAFNGSGPAPRGLSQHKIEGTRAPRFGPLSIATPGLVATWRAVTEHYSTRPLHELLAPAIAQARHGFPVYPRLEEAITKLRMADGPLAAFLQTNGRTTGELFRQPALAATLELISREGVAAFYSGVIARSIVDHVQANGGALDVADLADSHISACAPLGVTYRGHEILTQPPVSLGCVLLLELRILEQFQVRDLAPGSPALIDLLVECKQAAFADAAGLGDPSERDNRLEWLLSDERCRELAQRISDRHSLAEPVEAAAGADTTSTVIADNQGNVVCLIQSLFNEWGSRELVPDVGVLLNDRLANLALDENLRNGLRPGRRPMHTLHTYMVLEDGEPTIAGATPGGRGQVQTNLQVLVNILDFGMDVQTAVDEPHWISGLPYRGQNDQTLYLEAAFPLGTVSSLRDLGYVVEHGVQRGDQADPFGNCTVIARSNGTFQGASDSRRDALAIGW